MRGAFLSLGLGLVLFGGGLSEATAQESIPLEIVQKTKEATVFIKFKSGVGQGAASGFLIRVEGQTAYIATNDHVAFPRHNSAIIIPGGLPGAIPGHGPGFGPDIVIAGKEIRPEVPAAEITIFFHSGTKREQSYKAEVVAADPERDLAILKIEGAKDLPAVIDIAPATDLVETMPVYGFGFPLGETLATGKRNPAITVTRASISGVRTDEEDEVVKVQIDGALNPGNSGGPVLDNKGRLVGIVYRGVRGSGIAFAIPAHELTSTMAGRPGAARLEVKKATPQGTELTAKVPLIDPLGKIKAVTLYHVPTTALASAPGEKRDRLDEVREAVRVELPLQKQVASASFTVNVPARETISWQAAYVTGEGKPVFGPVQVFDPNDRKDLARDRAARPQPRLPVGGINQRPTSVEEALAELGGNVFSQMNACDYLAEAALLKERQAEVATALEPLLTDRNNILRHKALDALAIWATREQVPALLQTLNDSSSFVRKRAITALGSVRDPRAVAPLAKSLTSNFEREAASNALIRMGPMVEAEVRKYLDHADQRTRAEAARVLREIGRTD